MNDDANIVIIGAGVVAVAAVFGLSVFILRHIQTHPPPPPPTYLVTLKILRRRTQRSTEMPRGCMAPTSTRVVSRMPPQTTKQSKRLKKEDT